MKRISIQGVISGPLPAIFSDYVDDGIVTPVNSFTKALRKAEEAGEEIEIWINSPGGDVDAANEMLAAFQSFKGYKCVTIGGLAASAAAYFALQCGARVECHENTRFMFHSARVLTEGGPGSLRDTVEALEKINAPVKARLKALGMDPARIDEGFRDDRALWIDAGEAKALGIVQKIVKGAAPLPARPTPDRLAGVPAGYGAVAAMLSAYVTHSTTGTTAMTPEDNPAAPVADLEPAPVADPAPAEESGAAPKPEPETPAEEPPVHAPETPSDASLSDSSVIVAKAMEHVAEMRAERDRLAVEEAALRVERDQLRADLDAATAKLADFETRTAALAAALDDSRAAHAALVGRVLAPESAADPALVGAATPHLDALRTIGNPTERDTYRQAHWSALLAEYKAKTSRR